ncbi:hypothetical protein FB005_107303 [Sinorhizobium medicae]|nr:hypothetical protein FB006_1646 [Sinorhizobium medicae]TWA34160.1 hypothetical protein FB007_1076 [Sinorhizobium medicae]TWA44226.1 hypothetical protein FB005_107303 [Sinorhizobium medicae]
MGILQILKQDDGAHPVALELVWHKNAHRTGGDPVAETLRNDEDRYSRGMTMSRRLE